MASAARIERRRQERLRRERNHAIDTGQQKCPRMWSSADRQRAEEGSASIEERERTQLVAAKLAHVYSYGLEATQELLVDALVESGVWHHPDPANLRCHIKRSLDRCLNAEPDTQQGLRHTYLDAIEEQLDLILWVLEEPS